ncbi:hypothetical protein [Haloarchaeobius iranensis]|uniref:Lipoprotein n=1 Tax=Haloarchaeobius iranensis TaxID=996166 RepID=A0A1G9TDK7_9EURY|nr:hypothetical protein [Haloarchaeobius iranensis]SDM45245.1 hypothetical protein SAMN05192554_102263 [Haloarchaeobius iranensis]
MRRRTVLAGGGATFTTLLGGCFSADTLVDDSPSLPPGLSVTTEHVVWDVLPDSRDRRERLYDGGTVHRLFTERENATRAISAPNLPASFLDETDFDESFVVVVQYGRQSATWLELDRIERTDDGLDIVARVAEPSGGYGDDLAIHSLLLRVTDPAGGVPESLRATVVDDP